MAKLSNKNNQLDKTNKYSRITDTESLEKILKYTGINSEAGYIAVSTKNLNKDARVFNGR